MTEDDVLFRFRLRALALAEELGSVRAACRALGIHHSTYYRWQRAARRFGLEVLRPRERRPPAMPNQTSPMVEQRILAFSLAHPGYGPARIASELGRPKWGAIPISPNGVWQVLRRHGLNTRRRRLALVAGYACPPDPARPEPTPARHLEVHHPGQLVGLDCFYVGRLAGTRGVVWQYTAIDTYSSYLWAELHVTPRNPSARFTSLLAHRVAGELRARGWVLEAVLTDNASEFTSAEFAAALASQGTSQRRIHAGRPQTNGAVERVQLSVLEECWRPAFARYLIPKLTGLRRELARYVHDYNTDRAHTGRITRGRTPDEVLGKAKMWTPRA